MKRKLLVGAFLIGSLCTIHAQQTCASPQIVSPGTITAPEITGTYNDLCWGFGTTTASGEPAKGLWYLYVPPMDGTLTISSDFPENDGDAYSDDTKISVFTGNCGNLVCAYQADDNTGGSNFLETLEFEVTAGVWHYIHWDNFQNSQGFKFSVDFDPIDVPETTVPYEFGFDTNSLNEGWTLTSVTPGSTWTFLPHDTFHPSHEGDGLVGLFGSTEQTNAWAFSRGIELEAGQTIDINYFVRSKPMSGTGGALPYEVTIGTEAEAASQTNVLETFDDVENETYAEQTHTFTADEAGIYYVGFHCTAPAQTGGSSMLLVDTFSVEEGTAGINDLPASAFKLFPNPATNDLTIQMTGGLAIDSAQLMDINGRIIKSFSPDNTIGDFTFPVDGLSNGMYFVKLASGEKTAVKKFLKK